MIELLKKYRRDLHKIPELGFDLPLTTAYAEGVLKELGCKVFRPAPSSICAFFDAGKADTVAFRADMDALPVREETGAAYASDHPGCMHACGHDGHTALLLAFGGLVRENLKDLPRNVLLIFQPAEETTGGAKAICESGVLEAYKVCAIFGLHLWPELPKGEIWSRPGPLMAKTGIVRVEIEGKSAHVTRSEEGADALAAGVEFLHLAYEMAKSMEPIEEARLLKFGYMQSGVAENAVSAHTSIRGTLRAFSSAMHARMKEALAHIAGEAGKKTGCKLTLSVSDGYPALRNDEGLYARILTRLGQNAPSLLPRPFLTGEDFSFYQERVPGVFFFLGTGGSAPLHSATFDFDEAVLVKGLELYRSLLGQA